MAEKDVTEKVRLRLYEAGQGYPDVGEVVYDPRDGCLYSIVSVDDRISTHGPGVGNSIDVVAVECSERLPLDDAEWDAMVHVRVEELD